MDDAKVVSKLTGALENSLTESEIISSNPTDPKPEEILVENDSKAEAPSHANENSALVLEQLLHVHMSSPILLINETPPAKIQLESSMDFNSSSGIDILLDGLVAPAVPLFTAAEQLDDVNISDDANVISVLYVPKIDAQISQPGIPEMETNLLQCGETQDQDSSPVVSMENQHPTSLQDPPMSGVIDSDQVLTVSPKSNIPSLTADVDSAVKIPTSPMHQKSFSVDSPKYVNDSIGDRVIVDTAAPFDSVKEAVSKFGGIVDWKAHKVQTVERRKFIEQELDKAQEDVPIYRKMSQTAEEAKSKVLQELNTAKRLIEDMKLNVERAQTEEHQAKQDAELAKLRVEEMEEGIAEESSIAAKAQLEVAKGRHSAAISDLQCAKEELESIKKEYVALKAERDMIVKRAEEAKAAAKEVERTVQDLTIELISTKEALESAHAKHLEAEEGRLTAALAKEQNSQKWEKELKEVEAEVAVLSEQVSYAKELQSKFDAASATLLDLKAELANYKESKLNSGTNDESLDGEQKKSLRRTHTGIQAAVSSAQKELEDVRLNIEKAIEEMNLLKLASSSLESELESERATVAGLKQKQGTKLEMVHSLEYEINQMELELAEAKVRETEAREKMMNLPMQLPQAAEEADRIKSQTQRAREELEKVKEEAERAKAGVVTMESRLIAAEKEKEAATASENLALAAIKALQESESARTSNDVSSPTGVVISLEEYHVLSKRAQEAEEKANQRVASAIYEMEIAKISQLKSMDKLEELNEQVTQRRRALKLASQKAEEAAEGKFSLEQELRKWRASSEKTRKETEPPVIPVTDSSSKTSKSIIESSLPTAASPPPTSTATETEASSPDVGMPTKKKKRSFFPRVLMFLAKRKTNSSK